MFVFVFVLAERLYFANRMFRTASSMKPETNLVSGGFDSHSLAHAGYQAGTVCALRDHTCDTLIWRASQLSVCKHAISTNPSLLRLDFRSNHTERAETLRMAKIQIVVGSVTGMAEGVADFIKENLDNEHQIDTNVETTVEDLVRDDGEFLLFCTSNTGCGDLPDNIYPLYEDLREIPPKIAGRRYALINIGDSSFPTFGEAGAALDTALKDIGAQPVAESLLIDVGEERYPQKIALDWVKNILK